MATKFKLGVRYREMLAGPPQGTTCGMYGVSGGRGEVETTSRERVRHGGVKMSALQVRLEHHVHEKGEQEVGGTKREHPVRRQNELSPLLAVQQPSFIQNKN